MKLFFNKKKPSYFLLTVFGLFLLFALKASAQQVGGVNITVSPARVKVGQTFRISVTGLKQGDRGKILFGFKSNYTEPIAFDDINHAGVGQCNEGFCTFSYTPTLEFVGQWNPLAKLDNRDGNAITSYEIFADKPALTVSPSCVSKGSEIRFNVTKLVPNTQYTFIFNRKSDNTTRNYKHQTGGLGAIATSITKSFPVTDNDFGDWTARVIDEYLATESNVANYKLVASQGECSGSKPTSPTPKPPDATSPDECQECVSETKKDCSPPDSDFCSEAAIKATSCASQCGGDKPDDGSGLPIDPEDKGDESSGNDDEFSGIDLDIEGVYKIIVGIACWLMRVAVALIVIFLIYSGFKFLISKGDAAKVTDARKNLQSVIIGIVVIVGVYVIIGSIATAIGAGEHYSFFTCSESE